MQFFLQLNASTTQSVLERVLGVVRFRGFQVSEMTAHTPHGSKSLIITLKVTGQRTGENLKRQLEKLLDVTRVDLFTLEQPAAVVTPIHMQPALGVAV